MSDERWGYASGKDAEAWTGMFLTRDEAIAEGLAHFGYLSEYGGKWDGFWIHSGHRVPLEAVMPDADDIIETMGERAYDEAGECAEEYPDLTLAAKAELVELLYAWAEKYAQPQFWVADGDAEFIAAPLAAEGKEKDDV